MTRLLSLFFLASSVVFMVISAWDSNLGLHHAPTPFMPDLSLFSAPQKLNGNPRVLPDFQIAFSKDAKRFFSFQEIEGFLYVEAQTANGTLYLRLPQKDIDGSFISTNCVLVSCSSNGECKNCKYTGGTNCGCANGSNDCVFSEMGFGTAGYMKNESKPVKHPSPPKIQNLNPKKDSLTKVPQKPTAEGQSGKKI